MASRSTVTWTPQGAAALSWSANAVWASAAAMPGGTRRLRRAEVRGTMDAEEPVTGGQSMPSTVTAGRAQSMSDTCRPPAA